MPVCKSCGVDKPRKEFRRYKTKKKNNNYISGWRGVCIPCYTDKMVPYQRRYHLKWKYGITLEEYNEMAKDGCDLCGKTSEENKGYLNVDHNHETGKVRGILCRSCNTAIGKLGDNVAGLTKALEYLNASN